MINLNKILWYGTPVYTKKHTLNIT